MPHAELPSGADYSRVRRLLRLVREGAVLRRCCVRWPPLERLQRERELASQAGRLLWAMRMAGRLSGDRVFATRLPPRLRAGRPGERLLLPVSAGSLVLRDRFGLHDCRAARHLLRVQRRHQHSHVRRRSLLVRSASTACATAGVRPGHHVRPGLRAMSDSRQSTLPRQSLRRRITPRANASARHGPHRSRSGIGAETRRMECKKSPCVAAHIELPRIQLLPSGECSCRTISRLPQ
jgi:hypothetical protein